MKILKMTRSEYIRWLFHSRMLILPCVFILIYIAVTEKMLKYAARMGTPVNILEPFIGVVNSPQLLCLVPIIFLVLMSDFPRVDNNIIYKIFRMGRKKWVVSQLLFLFMADITFVFLLFMGITLPVVSRGFLYNGWSDYVTELALKLSDISDTFAASLIPVNLYYQMLPYKALSLSVLLMVLHFYLMGLMILVLKLAGFRIAGTAVPGFLLVFGVVLTEFFQKAQWIFPAAHGLLQLHFSMYFRKMYCSISWSVIYFAVFILLFTGLAVYHAGKINYTKIIVLK